MPVSEHLRNNSANLEAVGSELLDHIDTLTDNFNALLAKIDADEGDTGGDSDYEETLEV